MNRREILGGGLALSASALAPLPAFAQAKYPERPIRLIVPFAAGGVVDAVARQFAERIKPHLGTIVIENIGGAGGTIGMGEVARAKPDGYTLGLCNTSTMVINPAIMPKMPYNAEQGFRADLHPRGVGERHHREPERAGEEPQGVHRLRQGQPGQAFVRLGRRRHHDASRRRAVQAADRHAEDRARALQGRRPEHHRSRRRRGADTRPST